MGGGGQTGIVMDLFSGRTQGPLEFKHVKCANKHNNFDN